jgi:hypothetical protein
MLDLATVRQCLWNDWDPIGVSKLGGVDDEYDSYAPVVLRMIEDGATVQELAAYLFSVQSEQMGLEGPEHVAARALLALKV